MVHTTLFILAGCASVGKTTLLHLAYHHGIPLFGALYQDRFRATNRSKAGLEYREFEEAWQNRSYFQAKHIPQLRQRSDLPDNVLVHLDLLTTLRRHVLTEREDAGQSSGLSNPRPSISLLDAQTNDCLMARYLSDSFFRRFTEVVVGTVYCTFPEAKKRTLTRKGRRLFRDAGGKGKEIYQELYRCWAHNLHLLKPSKAFWIENGEDCLRIMPSHEAPVATNIALETPSLSPRE